MIQVEPALRPAREVRLTSALNRWGGRPRVMGFFAAISRLGDGVFWYALMAFLPLIDGWRGGRASVHLALTGLVAAGLYRVLKRLTRRPRPFAQHRFIVARIAPLDEYSFPSGHTLHAVTFTIVACSHYPPLLAILVPFAALVAASRVVLGLHYPSDVAAACAIGIGLGALALRLGALVPL